MQTFYISVVAAIPQTYLEYVEQAALTMQPLPVVVQFDIDWLHYWSVVSVRGRLTQLNWAHKFVFAFHPHPMRVRPAIGVLLHSVAVEKSPHDKGFVRQVFAKSHPREFW